MKKINYFLSFILIALGSLIFFTSTVKANDYGCYVAHDYGPYNWVNRCNSWGAANKAQWLKICASDPYCETWWWDYGGFCFGKFYDVACDSYNSGQQIYCACGNTYTCPIITTPDPTITPTNVPIITYTSTPTPEVIITPVIGCQQDGKTFCSNHSGPVATVPYDVGSWSQCLSWCNDNMTPANSLCQYNADGPRNCWINSPPSGGIANCTWQNGAPPYGACYPGYTTPTPSPTPSPVTPPCITPAMSLNFSCNTLTASFVTDDTHNTISDSVTIQESSSSPIITIIPKISFPSTGIVRSASYALTSETSGRKPLEPEKKHPVTWTHRWTNKVSGNSSVECNYSITYDTDQFEIPSCASTVTNSTVENFTLPITSLPATFQEVVSHSAQDGYLYSFVNDENLYSNVNGLTCTKNLPLPATPTLPNGGSACLYNCSINGLQPTPVNPWNHVYKNVNPSCPNITSIDCKLPMTPPLEAFVTAVGYLKTSQGDVYIGGRNPGDGVIKQPNFPTNQSFSTRTISSSINTINDLMLFDGGNCASSNSICSSQKYLLINYSDKNTINPETWYSVLKDNLMSNSRINVVDITSYPQPPAPPSLINNNSPRVFNLLGSLEIPANSTCSSQDLVFISGDLTINPPFKIDPSKPQSACMFVVKGTVNINEGLDAPDNRDKIDAFIVAKNINIPLDSNEGLIIKGGLILTSESTEVGYENIFKRNVNSSIVANPIPSELIEYEGARYIFAFGDILRSPSILSIKESSYLSE